MEANGQVQERIRLLDTLRKIATQDQDAAYDVACEFGHQALGVYEALVFVDRAQRHLSRATRAFSTAKTDLQTALQVLRRLEARTRSAS